MMFGVGACSGRPRWMNTKCWFWPESRSGPVHEHHAVGLQNGFLKTWLERPPCSNPSLVHVEAQVFFVQQTAMDDLFRPHSVGKRADTGNQAAFLAPAQAHLQHDAAVPVAGAFFADVELGHDFLRAEMMASL